MIGCLALCCAIVIRNDTVDLRGLISELTTKDLPFTADNDAAKIMMILVEPPSTLQGVTIRIVDPTQRLVSEASYRLDGRTCYLFPMHGAEFTSEGIHQVHAIIGGRILGCISFNVKVVGSMQGISTYA